MIYIIATTKPWNIDAFASFTPNLKGEWLLVNSPQILEEKLGEGIKPRYIFFPHWSWLVPQKIYDHHECVCFHMTDVPYGRGGSPLQNLIIRGHNSTKLTALRMIDELDAGPVYLQTTLYLHGSAQEIFERVAALCYHLIEKIIEEESEPVVQQGESNTVQTQNARRKRAAPTVNVFKFVRFYSYA